MLWDWGLPQHRAWLVGTSTPSTITCPSLQLCSSPGSPTDVPAIFQEDSHPRRFGLTPGSPAPRPDLAPGSGSAAAPCSRLPCSLPSLSPLPPPALAQSWPLPTSLGPSPAFYKPSSFSRSPLSAPFLSPHRAPAPPGVRTLHWMPEGCACSQQLGWKPRGPRPQLDGMPGPDDGTSHPGPRHHQPLINRPTSAVCRSVGYRPPSCKDPGVATVVPFYVASELKTPLKNILGLSLSLRQANWPARGHLLGPPRQALKSDLRGFGVRTGNTAPILRF